MSNKKRYPAEVRERTVRLFFEQRGNYETEWAAITSIAGKAGMSPETVRLWVRQAEIDRGQRNGITTEESRRVRELERENKELRRANEILKAAASFFGAELDRQHRK